MEKTFDEFEWADLMNDEAKIDEADFLRDQERDNKFCEELEKQINNRFKEISDEERIRLYEDYGAIV